jgi:methylase of polypeptide subunit release factors
VSELCLQDRLERAKQEPRLGIHSFHRFFGKLIPAIPAAAIELFSEKGELVLDPFCGSGTTLVESIVRGRDVVGVDVNPLAVLVSKVKTTPVDPEDVILEAKDVMRLGRQILGNGLPRPPYCVNIHHWYRPSVIRELTALHAAVDGKPASAARRFLTACLSAINRNVSNADPQHVFPGYSKRMRRLDLERGRRIDVFETFASGVRKRAGYMEEMLEQVNGTGRATVHCAHADDPPKINREVALIITNPPYISSVRYLETLKLEMSWAGMIGGTGAYRELDRMQIGTERFGATEKKEFLESGVKEADEISRRLFKAGHGSMSRTISLYFRRMASALKAWDRALRPGGRMVFKLSPSRVRDELVPTPAIISRMLERLGYSLEEEFPDEYNPNSRSLLTARNHYSGRIDSDTILVLGKR